MFFYQGKPVAASARSTAQARRSPWRARRTWVAAQPPPEQGQIAVGVSSHTSLLRPMTAGRIGAATAIRHGRTQQPWQAGIIDEASRLIATGHVKLRNAGPRP
jgi:acyl-coenzyme A thioesterase PaaI-like protein